VTPGNGFALTFNAESLRPLVAEIVQEALARFETARATLPDKLAFGEQEAARLLSLQPYQLRDERLRGRIAASVGPGRRVLYRRADLENYLLGRRWCAK
jgi:hypothetical protein